MTAEGIIGTKAASPELLRLAKTVATEKDLALRFAPYKLLTTDGTVFLMRNYPTVSLMAFDEEGLLPNWHWPTDQASFVNPDNLDAAKDWSSVSCVTRVNLLLATRAKRFLLFAQHWL